MYKNTVTEQMRKDACVALQAAFAEGDENKISEAFEQFHQSVADVIKQDYLEAGDDQRVLAERGYRQLTKGESEFYQGIIKAGKSDNPKQAFADLPTETRVMPSTIIEDIYKNLVDEHPLLAKISFTNVMYLTRWILNDHTVDTAVWGDLNDSITKEIGSAFKVIEVVQCKLSAYAVIEKDMLDMGPTYLDAYIRTILKDAIACGLEKGIVSGTGHKQPIGLDRDIHDGVTINSSTGYPQKTAIAVKNFLPKTYGAVLAKLAKTEKGRLRKFDKVLMICNQADYLTKIMPATTVLTNMGTYANNLFPFPTEIVRSNEVPEGKAIVCLPEEYFMGLGSSKDGNIEYSDDFKFLDDQRTYKIKLYGMGKAFDDTVAVLLDISALDEAYITVKTKADAAAVAANS